MYTDRYMPLSCSAQNIEIDGAERLLPTTSTLLTVSPLACDHDLSHTHLSFPHVFCVALPRIPRRRWSGAVGTPAQLADPLGYSTLPHNCCRHCEQRHHIESVHYQRRHHHRSCCLRTYHKVLQQVAGPAPASTHCTPCKVVAAYPFGR